MESLAFKNASPDFGKLAAFGFLKKGGAYVCEKPFMRGAFRAAVSVSEKGNVSGRVYDAFSGDEYLPLRIENAKGAFVGEVKAAYRELLAEIRRKCFVETAFAGAQANRIAARIRSAFGDAPEFPWEDEPDSAVFKNPESGKWYALLVNLEREKLGDAREGEVEILNLKLAPEEIRGLLGRRGFYPAWHMNKKHWITLALDETLADGAVLKLLAKSRALAAGRPRGACGEWLIPANPKYYDVVAAFRRRREILWKQSACHKPGDIVYMYVGAPHSAVLYKCEVVKADIPYKYEDENVRMKKAMKIRLLKRYAEDFMTFAKLRKYGVRAVRGPRGCPPKLCAALG